MEIWKDIEGYEGFYLVSDQGSVKSVDRYVDHPRHGKQFVAGRILRPGTCGWGYQFVYLCKDGKPKMRKLHRLVALAYVENPDPVLLPDVNHEDGDKKNNRATNLTWSNDSMNQKHAFDTGLNKALSKIHKKHADSIRGSDL